MPANYECVILVCEEHSILSYGIFPVKDRDKVQLQARTKITSSYIEGEIPMYGVASSRMK
jgi:hypothetical protein